MTVRCAIEPPLAAVQKIDESVSAELSACRLDALPVTFWSMPGLPAAAAPPVQCGHCTVLALQCRHCRVQTAVRQTTSHLPSSSPSFNRHSSRSSQRKRVHPASTVRQFHAHHTIVVMTALSSVLDGITDVATSVADRTKDVATSVADTAEDVGTSTADRVEDAATSIADALERLVEVHLHNETPHPLHRVDAGLDHGAWTGEPPPDIAAQTEAVWGSRAPPASPGGVDGHCYYALSGAPNEAPPVPALAQRVYLQHGVRQPAPGAGARGVRAVA